MNDGDVQNLMVGVDVNGGVAGNTEDTRVGVEVLVKGELEDGGAALAVGQRQSQLTSTAVGR